MSQLPTAADEGLIGFAAEHGWAVEVRQLRRWRQVGLLPHRARRGLGRALGIEGKDPLHAAPQLVALCTYRERLPRSARNIAISLWYDGWDIRPSTVRDAVVGSYERMLRHASARLDKLRADEPEVELDVLEVAHAEAQASASPFTALERAVAKELPVRYDDPSGARRRGDELLVEARTEFVGTMLGASGAQVPDEELLRRYFQLDRMDEVAARTDSRGAPPQLLPDLLDLVSLKQLIAVVSRCTSADLDAVRDLLRGYHEALDTRGILQDLDVDASSLVLGTSHWDTRHPGYDPRQLIAGVGATLAYLMVVSPDALSDRVQKALKRAPST